VATRAPGNHTILLAEDTDEIRHMLAEVLCENGYRVLEAGDGMEALKLSDSYAGSIDILITDVTMPRLSGLDLIRDLKPRRPGTRVLAISGWTNAVLDPGTPFLQKPFTPTTLLRKIDEIVAGGTSTALPTEAYLP
jgi:two-component system cell cycle sensor histidine kinase/response regulator CckA